MPSFVRALAVAAFCVAGLLVAGGSRDAAAAPVVIAAAIPHDEAADIRDTARPACTEPNAQRSSFAQEFARAKGVDIGNWRANPVDGAQLGDG